jgi:hypothetical protein
MPMSRRGMSIPLVLVGLVITMAGASALVQSRMRTSAHMALARSLALRDAVAAGESALEEAVFRFRHPPAGRELLDPAGALAARVEPEETRRLAAPPDRAGRIAVGNVDAAQLGPLTTAAGEPDRGTLECKVEVRVVPASLLAPAVRRTLVRHYAFQIHRVSIDDGSGTPRVVFSQVRLDPRPTNQWVMP